MKKITVKIIENRILMVDGKLVPLYSGSFHYWRHPIKLWKPIMEKIKELNFPIICTYIPWGIHEIKKGKFDFSGNKNIEKFLQIAKELGLYVIASPGPHINSELSYFGYPKRVMKLKENLIWDNENNPIAIPYAPRTFFRPSSASTSFYKEVELWFDAIDKILKKNLYPKGSIIAIQLDNENSMFFYNGFTSCDYNPGAIELYRTFLKEKYNNISELKKIYNFFYNDFQEITPPREVDIKNYIELPFYFDWHNFKEYYIVYGLNKLVGMHNVRGITSKDVLFIHNLPGSGYGMLFNISLFEELEYIHINGANLYPGEKGYFSCKRLALFLSTMSRLPFISEFECGTFPILYLFIRGDSITNKNNALNIFMHGIKGVNYYMLVDRDGWWDSPIARDGRIRNKLANFYKKLNKILYSYDFTNVKRYSSVLLLKVREYTILENIMLETPLFFVNTGEFAEILIPEFIFKLNYLGFKDRIPIENSKFNATIFYTLTKANIQFAMAGTEKLELENSSSINISKWKYVIVNTYDFLNETVQKRLVNYINNGGILILGPRAPILNEKMKECKILFNLLEPPNENLEEIKLGNNLVLKNVDCYEKNDDIEVLIQQSDKILCYKKEIGVKNGAIIHFGFNLPKFKPNQIPKELINIIDKLIPSEINKKIIKDINNIDWSIFYNEKNRKIILFISNYGKFNETVEINLNNIRNIIPSELKKFNKEFEVVDLLTKEYLNVKSKSGIINLKLKKCSTKMFEVL